MDLRINTGAEPIHGSSLTKEKVKELLEQVEAFDFDKRTLADQYNEIEELITILINANLTNEADSMNIAILRTAIKSKANNKGKRGDMPTAYINKITTVLENILPFAKNVGGRRRRKTRRHRHRHTRKRV